MRKVCLITGTRAEYGLLYWLMKEIESAKDLKLQLVVTGMHLSPEFGNTFEQIEKDGFSIDKKIDLLLSSDSELSISKSISIGIDKFAITFNDLKPDLILVLGDRYEIFSAVSAAMVARIPVAHIHGGETTEGAIDEPIRHSITKMSHLHFPATSEYQNRIIQLGKKVKKIKNIDGRFVGITKFSKKIISKIINENVLYNVLKKNKKIDLTNFLMHLINENYDIFAIKKKVNWHEFDEYYDFKKFIKIYKNFSFRKY